MSCDRNRRGGVRETRLGRGEIVSEGEQLKKEGGTTCRATASIDCATHRKVQSEDLDSSRCGQVELIRE